MSGARKKFDALQKQWYAKLAESGFEDIENSDGSLKAATDIRVIKRAFKDKEEREAYYSIAADFLNAHAFSTKEERLIWEAHCEGEGRLSIAKRLDLTYYRVNLIITKLQKLAKLRKTKW